MEELGTAALAPEKLGGVGVSTEKGIGWQNLPDPSLRSINPFTQARNLAGRMQIQIAEELGVTPLYIMRLEQAVFSRVPARVAGYYAEVLGMPDKWEAGYRTFQRLIRQSAPRPITGHLEMPSPPVDFRRWRLTNWPTMSQVGWCKAFCIHPASLYAIEKGEQERVPADILTALIEAKILTGAQALTFANVMRMRVSKLGGS